MSTDVALELMADMVKAIEDNPGCLAGIELTVDPVQQWPRMKRLTIAISLPCEDIDLPIQTTEG